MKNKARLQAAAEWCLLALIVGIVMGLGAARMHQLQLNWFLVVGFVSIAVVMAVYRMVYRKWFVVKDADSAE